MIPNAPQTPTGVNRKAQGRKARPGSGHRQSVIYATLGFGIEPLRGMGVCLLPLLLMFLLPQPASAQPPPRDRLEESVAKALGFLQTMQETDGSWHVNGEKNPGISALAIMAFLSAGHVPGEGPYGPTVEKGIRWVLQKQLPNGLFASNSGHEMYHHGICTLMLAEATGMTDRALAEELRPKLAKAVALIVKAQVQVNQYKGGWRYRVDSADADVSVSGWQLLALRAAKNLGCDVPAERIDWAVEFLLRCRDSSGGFGYMPGGRVTLACTGTCILGLELARKTKNHAQESLQAGSYLLRHPVRWDGEHFCYGLYYSSQAMFQLGHNYWNTFRPQMHKELFDHQKSNGSWIANDGFGPVYGTSMCVLGLTVEYRFLPIYQRDEEKGDMK